MWTYICHGPVALVGVAIVLNSPLRADIKNWQTGETILGTGEEVLFWQFAMFDLDTSSAIDAEDRRVWVHELKKTWFGDANLDGVFNNGDLVTLLQAGEYEDGLYGNSSWGTGDWDGDGDFTRQDLVLALRDGGYGQGPRAALAAVPEPNSWCLLAVGVLAIAPCTRSIGRRKSCKRLSQRCLQRSARG
jgi:hypothetical protein